MSKGRSIDKIKQNKNNAIKAITLFLDNLFNEDAPKSDKLSFWIQNYLKFLDYEKRFQPNKLIRYVRGDIIKVDFGFRIGSELGGLHYCVVIDNYNSINANTITVVPLSSVKNIELLNNLPKDRVFLGNDLSDKVKQKAEIHLKRWVQAIEDVEKSKNDSFSAEEYKEIKNKMYSEQKNAKKIINEFTRMKYGSIALVGQIATISKIRICDPKNIHNVLHGVRLSPENLDLINKKIQDLYIHS